MSGAGDKEERFRNRFPHGSFCQLCNGAQNGEMDIQSQVVYGHCSFPGTSVHASGINNTAQKLGFFLFRRKKKTPRFNR